MDIVDFRVHLRDGNVVKLNVSESTGEKWGKKLTQGCSHSDMNSV
jgi:hypothetical protein